MKILIMHVFKKKLKTIITFFLFGTLWMMTFISLIVSQSLMSLTSIFIVNVLYNILGDTMRAKIHMKMWWFASSWASKLSCGGSTCCVFTQTINVRRRVKEDLLIFNGISFHFCCWLEQSENALWNMQPFSIVVT